MKVLLDTHILLWALSEPQKIPAPFRTLLQSLANECFVSAVSITEMLIKASIGKLECTFDPVEEVEAAGFTIMSFRGKDALALKELPFHHRDPFDRMLISQSLSRNLPIMTCDKAFGAYECDLVE